MKKIDLDFYKFDRSSTTRIRFLDLNDKDFALESCYGRHFINVVDKDDNKVKVLSLPTGQMKQILEIYRAQMIRDRLIMSQKEAARRFKFSKMKTLSRQKV